MSSIASIESAIEKFIESIPAKISRFLDKPAVKTEITNIQNQINHVLNYAIPAVQAVEAATQNKTLAEVEAVLRKAQVVAQLDPSTAFNSPVVEGLLLQAPPARSYDYLADAGVKKTSGET